MTVPLRGIVTTIPTKDGTLAVCPGWGGLFDARHQPRQALIVPLSFLARGRYECQWQN